MPDVTTSTATDPTTTTPTDPPPAPEPGAWRADLPEDIRDDAALASINDVPALAKSLIHAQRMVGADKVVLPGKDATDEQKAEFYTALGRPEKPEGYEIPTEGMPEGLDIPPESLESYYQAAHDLGLNTQQVAGLYRWLMEDVGKQGEGLATTAVEEKAAGEKVLREEFGDAYDQRMAVSKKAVRDFGGDELVAFLNDTGLGDSPALVKAFSKIGIAVGTDEIIGTGAATTFGMTPEEAQAKIAVKEGDAEFMKRYHDQYVTGHLQALEEMKRLYAAAHPE